MLTLQQRLQAASQPVTQPSSLTAPVKGWNTRDALDAMDPLDAVLLDNWYPDGGGCNVRGGHQQWASGLGSAPVETLASYYNNGVNKFLAACADTVWDISNPLVPASLGTGFLSDRWQTVNFLSHLFMVNGRDTMQIFDGTSLTDASFTGVTLSTLSGVCLYQQRLFFWSQQASGFWYAPLNSISGSLSYFDLTAFASLGGNLVAATTFSHDGGNGVLDFICFIMSSGQCLMYYGNDPSTSTAWQLVGIYTISPPVSPRAVCNYGAEAFLTTFDDHVPLQQQLVALKLGQLPPRSKISNAVLAATTANPNGFGWQALYYPTLRALLFNIPNPDGTFSQHVMNTSTEAWARWQDLPASCWGLFGDNLFFGGAGGIVYQANVGNMDLAGAVTASAQQAWNTFDNPMRKRITTVRPVISAAGELGYNFGIGFDYGDINVPVAQSIPAIGSPWDTSPWDVSPWSPEVAVNPAWRIGGGSGQAVGFALNVSSTLAVSWLRTDMRWEQGSAL